MIPFCDLTSGQVFVKAGPGEGCLNAPSVQFVSEVADSDQFLANNRYQVDYLLPTEDVGT